MLDLRSPDITGNLFLFPFFNFRFSFGLSWAFFCCSFLPLSFFPLSAISVFPCLKVNCAETVVAAYRTWSSVANVDVLCLSSKSRKSKIFKKSVSVVRRKHFGASPSHMHVEQDLEMSVCRCADLGTFQSSAQGPDRQRYRSNACVTAKKGRPTPLPIRVTGI